MFQSSIVSYGENGRDKRYGRSNYRGNTDGGIVKDFLDYCDMKFGRPTKTCSDYMAGSFTTRDVCMERGVSGVWTDLSEGFNMLSEACEIPDRPESIFWHPPYSSLIGIPYAGAEWGAKKEWTVKNGKNVYEYQDELDEYIEKYGFDPKEYDLGRMDWDKFIKALSYCCLKQYAALETGGRMGILMGDIRRNGVYKSMLLDMAKPGEVESIVIKRQNHASSSRTQYSNLNYIPIEQEYFLILKKAAAYILDFSYPKKQKLDIRDSESVSWKELVAAILETKKELTLSELYAEIDGHKKAQKNPNWQAKVRQSLQKLRDAGVAKHVDRGVWVIMQ